MTKVIHLQKHLPSSGNAAFRLHEAMRRHGINSSMLSLTSDANEDNYIKHLNKKAYFISFLNDRSESKLTKKNVPEFGLFSYPVFGNDISKMNQVRDADIIYLHWAIGGFLNLNGIEKLAKLGKPMVVFMHDMWSITGGCHYSFECEKFKVLCQNCQNFQTTKRVDLSTSEFKKKMSLYAKYKNLYFVSPSKWLYDQAKASALTANKPNFHIPNVLNKSIFKQSDKDEARRVLGIDTTATVIAFGAVTVNSPYKGWNYLQKSLEILKQKNHDSNIIILIFGMSLTEQIAKSIPFPIRSLGRLRDDYSTALVYNASDVFLAPSLADNLPTTVMESLGCGTAVVGFNIGGIKDMIVHKKNGYLANYKDPQDLAEGIEYCIGNHITGYLTDNFNEEKIMSQHLDLFKIFSFS